MPEEKKYLWFVQWQDKNKKYMAHYYSSSLDSDRKFERSLHAYWVKQGITGNQIFRSEIKEGFEEI